MTGRDRARVVLFPGAGSFGAEFRPIVRELRPGVRTLRYAHRFDAGPAVPFDRFAARCADEIGAAPGGTVLLGHSFGAYAAYATAAILQSRGTGVAALVVLGADAPDRLSTQSLPVRGRNGVETYLREQVPGLLEQSPDPEWTGAVIDAAERDLALLRGFDDSSYPPLRCPVLAALGRDDLLASEQGAAGWGRTTTARSAVRVLPGGHLDPLAHPEFLTWLGELVDECAPAGDTTEEARWTSA